MQCHGQCHMMKEMKQQEKKERSLPVSAKDKTELLQFYEDKPVTGLVPILNIVKYYELYKMRKLQDINFSIFHPPSLV